MNKTIRERLEEIFKENLDDAAFEKAKSGQKVFFAHDDPEKPPLPHGFGDSLDRIEILMAIEEEFGVEISDKEAEGLDSIEKLENHLKAIAAK